MPTKFTRLAGSSPRKRILAPAPVKTAKTTKRILPPMEDFGVPSRERCNEVIGQYLQSLSSRKREKALISQAMFDDIWDVLQKPSAKIRTPQFRFWVRKMFRLSHSAADYKNGPFDSGDRDVVPVILHEERPVAVKEQIPDILSFYHHASGHGGRDKTMAEVRDRYSWVPKELVSRYVKACPTCSSKRPGQSSRPATLESLAARKLSLADPIMSRTSSSDSEYDALSSSSSQPVSLVSSEEGFMVNFAPDPRFGPASTLASLLESRILPPPVLSPVFRSPPLGSPNLSADPRRWLTDLAMQPGPNCVGTSHPLSPLLHRVGSENDAHPMHARVPLPPLMKALSEGMADEHLYRPAYNVPPGFQIPRRDSLVGAYAGDIVMSGPTSALDYPSSGGENANIDPALLGAQPVVTTYAAYHASQHVPGYSVYQPPTDLIPMDCDFRLTPMLRSISEESMSSVGSAQSLGSVASGMSGGGRGSGGEQSAKGMRQSKSSSSSDPQDWESSYCLDEM
ncbi:hypothetical protein PsYK624_091530 [Phanerochaete sordida]|uniref:Integrase zinc-binding domain-containing protein n=1 Tax=Phanerochaete sordida TaxID=48140 RepID=A0A9P3LFU5_9APHY|nr:hypothetical protein PsYK624_091530 [Phanerochaete sordida]